MPDAEVRWRLQGGFSQLVEGTHVELLLTSKPARGVLDAVPLELLKGRGAVDLDFRAARTFRVRGPGGLRWELGPEGRIEARLLCADSAFLGNFRVPAGHYGVQWTVIGRVSGVAKRPAGPFLVQATAGSWINYTWVDMATADAAPENPCWRPGRAFVISSTRNRFCWRPPGRSASSPGPDGSVWQCVSIWT